jgi:Carboxypeptidase regulatory-like domain
MVTLSRTVLLALLIGLLSTTVPVSLAEGLEELAGEALDAGPVQKARIRPGLRIRHQRLYISVADDNGKAVPAATVLLYSPPPQAVLRAETDFAGRCHFPSLVVGTYRLKVQKEGYYETTVPSVRVGQSYDLDVVLTRQKEVKEVVNVTESPVSIDPERTADTRTLSDLDIVNIPYANNRDYRAVLPYIPGVIQGPDGQPHIDGAHASETLDTLDGFNVSQPVTGALNVRVSADALRAIDVQTSRYSAQYGKASGGLLNLTTGTGDDHFRFNATNFLPSFEFRNGFNINNWTPRLTVSGPVVQSRVWFFNASEGEYDLGILKDLPSGANQSPIWRFSNLSKVQANLSASNILTGSLLVNHYNAEHVGLSTLALLPASVDQRKSAYFVNLKDQHYFHSGVLLEVGAAVSQFRDSDSPLGMSPYFISPERITGNYYRLARGYARRLETFSNLFLPEVKWHGRHEFRFGVDSDGVTYHQFYDRRPIFILGENHSLIRSIAFSPQSFIHQDNL